MPFENGGIMGVMSIESGFRAYQHSQSCPRFIRRPGNEDEWSVRASETGAILVIRGEEFDFPRTGTPIRPLTLGDIHRLDADDFMTSAYFAGWPDSTVVSLETRYHMNRVWWRGNHDELDYSRPLPSDTGKFTLLPSWVVSAIRRAQRQE